MKSFEGHSSYVNSVCFSADGNFILSGSSDNSIKLWDRISGALLKSFEGHSGSVRSVCFSADGNFILSGSNDRSIKLWDRISGALLKSFKGHYDSVNSVCFSADGNFILSGSNDNSIKLWDRISGAFICSFDSQHSIPLPILKMLSKNHLPSHNFVCSKIFKINETMLSCNDMLLINPISLSSNNSKVFLDKSATLHMISQINNKSSFSNNIQKSNLVGPPSPFGKEIPKLINENHKLKKSCKCLLL